jgi:hypothetical protein
MKIPAYVIELARSQAPNLNARFAGASANAITEAAWQSAYVQVDLGNLEPQDREAYVCASKAIACGLAS